ncbi:MAG: hypothetical protein HQK51_19905 [Oligoflexia bacterium]|nr:hypothetical protein [Oligoflexia bacterium]
MLKMLSKTILAVSVSCVFFQLSFAAVNPVNCTSTTTVKQCVEALQKSLNSLIVENQVLSNRVSDTMPALPNIWKNTKFSASATTPETPTSTPGNLKYWFAYNYGGGETIYNSESLYTHGFVGIYAPENAASYVSEANVSLATATNPVWYGVYNTGPRISRNGWATGSYNILRLHVAAGKNAGGIRQHMANTIHSAKSTYVFGMYVKFLKGNAFGISQDVTNTAAIISKSECDKSPQGWCRFEGEFAGSSTDNAYLGFGKPWGNEDEMEVLIALPYIYSKNALWAAHPSEI